MANVTFTILSNAHVVILGEFNLLSDAVVVDPLTFSLFSDAFITAGATPSGQAAIVLNPIPCRNAIKDCPPCDDSVLANFSAEAPDVDRFLSVEYVVGSPPLNVTFGQLGCKEWCYSEVSQDAANDCAVQQAVECVLVNWRNPDPIQIFRNTEQSCYYLCESGAFVTEFVAAGTISAATQQEADAIAFSIACRRVEQKAAKFNTPVTVTTSSPLDIACFEKPYETQLNASGGIGVFDWAIVGGALPSGLAMDTTGFISGTTTAAGDFSFVAQVASSHCAIKSKTFILTVCGITTDSRLADYTVGEAYSVQLSVSGCGVSPVFTLIEGALPPGITLNQTTGLISGTPTSGTSIVGFRVAVASAPFFDTICTKTFCMFGSEAYLVLGASHDGTTPFITPDGLTTRYGNLIIFNNHPTRVINRRKIDYISGNNGVLPMIESFVVPVINPNHYEWLEQPLGRLWDVTNSHGPNWPQTSFHVQYQFSDQPGVYHDIPETKSFTTDNRTIVFYVDGDGSEFKCP